MQEIQEFVQGLEPEMAEPGVWPDADLKSPSVSCSPLTLPLPGASPATWVLGDKAVCLVRGEPTPVPLSSFD